MPRAYLAQTLAEAAVEAAFQYMDNPTDIAVEEMRDKIADKIDHRIFELATQYEPLPGPVPMAHKRRVRAGASR